MQSSDIPAKFSIPWGNSAGASYIRTIPTASQISITAGAASLTDGFPPLNATPVASGGVPPSIKDMNGILKEITATSRWLSAGGPIAYDSTFQTAIGGYPAGAIVASATTAGVSYISTDENNATNPDSGGAGWLSIIGNKGLGQGLEDDGSGNLRVKVADSSIKRSSSGIQVTKPISAVSSAPTVAAANNVATYIATAPVTITLPQTSTLWNGFSFSIFAYGGAITLTPNSADKINGLAASAATVVPMGSRVELLTDGAGVWWCAIQQSASGGFINAFRNATLDIWSRGSSGSVSSGSSVYTADGWIVGSSGAATAWSRVTGRALSKYAIQLSGASGVTDAYIRQRIEGSICAGFASSSVTYQAQVYNGTGGAITPTLTVKHAGSLDTWTSPVTDVSAASLQSCANGTWTLVSWTGAASSSAGLGLEFTLDFGGSLNGSGNLVKIAECDVRVAAAAYPPELRPISIETQLCQRYLPILSTGGNGGGCFGTGGGYNAGTGSAGVITVSFLAPARATPTGVSVSNVSHFNVAYNGVNYTISGLSFVSASDHSAVLSFSGASGGTGNAPTYLVYASASATIFFVGAEL